MECPLHFQDSPCCGRARIGRQAPPGFWGCALVLCLLLVSAGVRAEDTITIGEVVPALSSGPLADVVVGPAPAPGTARTVRRRDIRRALSAHGASRRQLRGVQLPRKVRVSRQAREVERETLLPAITAAVAEVVAPCKVESVRTPPRVTLGTGELHVLAEPPARLRDGTVSLSLELVTGGQAQRLVVSSRLSCPAPVVSVGALVRVRVRVGAVVATAPGRARQPGRVGEVIRVINTATGARLSALVIDADTVEVVQ